MWCPKCGAEFREGILECSDCGIPLVENPRAEAVESPIEFVTVLESGDPSVILAAKSVLEANDILYFAKGEGVQDLFGAGRIGTGFNPLAGPVAIQVDKECEEEAKALLAELLEEG